MSEEENVKKHKIIKLSILVVLLVSLIFLREERRDWLENILVSLSSGEKELQLVTSINSPGLSNIKVYDSNIFTFNNNKISIYDMEGKLKLEEQYNFENLFHYFGNSYIYIGDKATGEIEKLDKLGQAKEKIDFKKPFFNIKEENNNTIYHTKSGDTESIYIHNKNNVLIGDHSFTGKNIINYTINASASKYAVALLDLQANTIKSELQVYGPNKTLLSSFEINGEILIYSKILKGDNIIALTDSSLYYIKDGKSLWSKPFSIIKDIYVDDKIYILYSNYLETISLDGKTIEKISFEDDYKKITPFNESLIVYGDNGMNLIEDGKVNLSYKGKIDLVSSNKRNLIILNNGKLDIYKIVIK